MNSIKLSFQDSLAKEVVGTGKCLGCGACVVACPFNCLEYVGEKPSLTKECKICAICTYACPQFDWSLSKIENFVFGKQRKLQEDFGIYRRLAIAQASDQQILRACQDGGAVTALLLYALNTGKIDGAIITKREPGKAFYPRPSFATTPEEILQSAGTKYFYSPNIFALTEAIKHKKSNIAFVGTPCQIRALRKMQMAGLKKYVAPLKVLIGLACSECFTYDGLMEKCIYGKMGIPPESIKKINIKGKMLITTDSGTVGIPLAETKQYTRQGCHSCTDFSAELSDVSAAGLGMEGWTFLIMRTEIGEELVSNAEKAGEIKLRNAYEEPNALNLLKKLSERKSQILGKSK